MRQLSRPKGVFSGQLVATSKSNSIISEVVRIRNFTISDTYSMYQVNAKFLKRDDSRLGTAQGSTHPIFSLIIVSNKSVLKSKEAWYFTGIGTKLNF